MIGTVLKTVDRFRLSVGSNPTPSASMTKEKVQIDRANRLDARCAPLHH